MAIYAIADLHLAKSIDKPMDVFGASWKNYMKKIEKNWNNTISKDDIVLIPGDISWATYLEESLADFEFIESLPGRKIISKGNHDYWWETVTKIKRFFNSNGIESIDILHNNSYETKNAVIFGTRGWALEDEKTEHWSKIVNREYERLKISYSKLNNSDKKKIAMFHYPPYIGDTQASIFTEFLKQIKADYCIYGHIHSFSKDKKYDFEDESVSYKLVSADYLEFKPYRLI